METGMKKIIRGGLLAACVAAAAAAPNPMEPDQLGSEMAKMRAKAQAGDYQAQRNPAHAYATGARLRGKQFPVAGCAWYLSIPMRRA